MAESLTELMAQASATRRLARAYEAAGKPARFMGSHGMAYLVSLDTETPGAWRVTYFQRDGQPSGHWIAPSCYDAFREVLAGGAVEIAKSKKESV
jgi:hypothetical protein